MRKSADGGPDLRLSDATSIGHRIRPYSTGAQLSETGFNVAPLDARRGNGGVDTEDGREDAGEMGFFSWLMRKIDRPADQSVLLGDRNRGSETMITAASPEEESAAAAGVRRDRARRRWRWLSGRGPFL